MSESDCLFCGIANRTIPATLVYEDDEAVAFRDIHPQAPVHLLVVPRAHIASLHDAGEEHGALLGRLLLTARAIAEREGLAEGGYRTVLNVGPDGGQTVPHIHVHLLGGRSMGWPPG